MGSASHILEADAKIAGIPVYSSVASLLLSWAVMTELKRLQIDYSGYRTADKQFLKGIDPTNSDEKLTADDLLKLSPENLDEIYRRFRTYQLDHNGYSTGTVDLNRIKSFVERQKTTPELYVRTVAQENQFLIFGEDHLSPKTRDFMARLPQILKQEGFFYLAIELDATRQGDVDRYLRTGDRSIFPHDKFPDSDFFPILDACKKAGLYVVCIDDPSAHGNRRGETDAKMFAHLQSHVLNSFPQAKVAVYIGNSHIDETEYLKYVKDGKIVDTPTKTGKLGYLLEKYAPHRSHSISLVDTVFSDDSTLDGLVPQD